MSLKKFLLIKMAAEANIDYIDLKVRKLKDLCRERGMVGYSKKIKQDL